MIVLRVSSALHFYDAASNADADTDADTDADADADTRRCCCAAPDHFAVVVCRFGPARRFSTRGKAESVSKCASACACAGACIGGDHRARILIYSGWLYAQNEEPACGNARSRNDQSTD